MPPARGRPMSRPCMLPILFAALGCGSIAAQSATRPNILLAISDDQSYPHASAYGDQTVKTPAFDRIAKEGVLFTNAFCASPGCSPSRAALLTGRHTWQLEHAGTHASSFDSKFVTFPDLLEDAGYVVGYTGKGWGPGNFKDGGRKRNPAGTAFSVRSKDKPPSGISRTDYAAGFDAFLAERPDGKPFCFWFGGHEPHRSFAKGVGEAAGKSLASVTVPAFLPDRPQIRSDLLDYYVEIEWFDSHLQAILQSLERAGELDNTLIIVTSDNGMAFPRAKANCYEAGIHVPLAIRFGPVAKAGRVLEDLVGFVDLTATILEAAGVDHPGAPYPPSGRSLMDLLRSEDQGLVDPTRDAVFSARERHSSSRWNNLAYPQRAIRTARFLYIRNFKPERWPAGAPQKLGTGKGAESLGPMHGGYHDIDGCPTLTFLIKGIEDPEIARYLHLAVDRRPAEELFDIIEDPGCLKNLAGAPRFEKARAELAKRLNDTLRETQDPRVVDDDGGEIFETYRRYSKIRNFPRPTDPDE